MNEEFVWDDDKAASNLKKHGIDFDDAILVFDDSFAVLDEDRNNEYGEVRYRITGMVWGYLVTAYYTERDELTRIISARKASKHEQKEYDQNQASF